MRILILGASGVAGSAIYEELHVHHTVYGTYFSSQTCLMGREHMLPLDISQDGRLNEVLRIAAPEIIVSCLQGDFSAQLQAHEDAARYLSSKENGRLFYLSSANVFDGDDARVHYEDDIPTAESEYGRFKIACEEMLAGILGERAAILRLPFIWSRRPGSRLDKLFDAVQKSTSIPAWSNLYTNHTTDRQIAAYVCFLLDQGKGGIFHVGSREACEYIPFLENLLRKVFPTQNIPFIIEENTKPSYLAVLSKRQDIPDHLLTGNEEILSYLTG